MRDTEMARRGYQLCENFAPLSMILVVIAGLSLFSISWIIVALCALIAVYGIYYRAQVALNAGQKSVATLALKQWSYGANRQLIRMLGFCIWYSFLSAATGPPHPGGDLRAEKRADLVG
jgi:hypothetical protein